MTISDQAYQQWLSQPGQIRLVLAELTHSAGTEYVASYPYISAPTDSYPNRIYDDVLSGALEIHQRIDSRLELGAIELMDDGTLTPWVNYLWRGYPVVLKLGSPEWSLDDFRVVARQTNAGVLEADRGAIQLGIYDAAAPLQQEISRPVLPNGQLVPLVLGKVFCVPATRISTSELRYQVSWLPVETLVVRDGHGPVMAHSPEYADGQFVALVSSERSLMCEVSEPHLTPLQIVQWVADRYGLSLADGLALPVYTLGLYYPASVSGAQILDDVCTAIGGHWQINVLGELDVHVFELPDAVPDLVLDADDIELGQIALERTYEPLKSLTLNYARNFTPITEVAGSLPAEDAARLSAEWLAVSSVNTVTHYPLAQDQTIDTALQIKSDAEAERDRRLSIKQQRHDVYRLTLLRAGMHSVVGQSVRVDHPRLAGHVGRVISSRSHPLIDKHEVEIWY